MEKHKIMNRILIGLAVISLLNFILGNTIVGLIMIMAIFVGAYTQNYIINR